MVRDRPAGLGHPLQCAHLHFRVHERLVPDQPRVCDCPQLHHWSANQRHAVQLYRLNRLHDLATVYEPTSVALQVQPGEVGLARQHNIDGFPGLLLRTGVLPFLPPT